MSVSWKEMRLSLPLISLRAYLSESLKVPRESAPSLRSDLRDLPSADRTTFSTFSAFSSFFSSFLSFFLSFLSFLESFLLFFLSSLSASLADFLADFSAAISPSALAKDDISSRAQRMSRTSASLELTEPCFRSLTARWSILSMRLILPEVVSHVASCRALRVRRLDSFWRSRSWSFFSFSAALVDLMASAVDTFLAFSFFPPPFLAAAFSAALAASSAASARTWAWRRASFS
mmetsp:Transcript_11022/g.30929  ORF Transcript_11022/g.30929 Transcript_11022/m.30929 type:complete len:233 (-) Transcript_11022:375-1073(-)